MQSIETRPDEQQEHDQHTELVEGADKAVGSQPLQQQQLAAAREVTKDSGAETVPRWLGSGSGRRRGQRVVW